MGKPGPFKSIIDQLEYKEKRDIYYDVCRDCKGAYSAMEGDCPDWCDEFAKEARDMISSREEEAKDSPKPIASV